MSNNDTYPDCLRRTAILFLFERFSFTVLQSLVKHFCWFCEHPGIGKEVLSSMEYSMLPPENNLPNSYEDALKITQPHLVKPIVYGVYANDCVIF